MNTPSLDRQTLLPFLAALVVLFAAWLLPVPGQVTGEEQLVAPRMPDTRADVEAAHHQFEQAQARYQSYVKTHDLSAVLANVQDAIAQAKADSSDPGVVATLKDRAAPIREYAGELLRYAQAGELYLAAIRRYDDDLMAWTRSLGAASEQLRSETWPFVEYIKRYPPPIGETADPPNVTAAVVATQTASLESHITALDASGQAGVLGIEQDVAGIWASGRSIEHIESLHAEYYRLLREYDPKVEAAANGTTNSARPDRVMLAIGLNLLVGVVTLGGLAALFMRRRT
ncbi:MAG TPA: hypothetical protein VEX13_03860 [Chloroflexia bacterium]|nr:hypothetical protein [Chloroflexia bacterium]